MATRYTCHVRYLIPFRQSKQFLTAADMKLNADQCRYRLHTVITAGVLCCALSRSLGLQLNATVDSGNVQPIKL